MNAVAAARAHFQRAMMMDIVQAAQAMRDEEMLAEIEDFIEGFNQPTYRGMRINGQRVATWSSKDGWSGDTRPDAEWIQRRLVSKDAKGDACSREHRRDGRSENRP
jgi:hypothetical protein